MQETWLKLVNFSTLTFQLNIFFLLIEQLKIYLNLKLLSLADNPAFNEIGVDASNMLEKIKTKFNI